MWEVPASLFRSLNKRQVLHFAELNIPPSREALVTTDDVEKPSHDHSEYETLQLLSILSAMSYPCINVLFLRPTRLLNITRLQNSNEILPYREPAMVRGLMLCLGSRTIEVNI